MSSASEAITVPFYETIDPSKDPVCLVSVPSPFLADERVFPSLGPLKVAASLKAAGVTVHYLDLSGVSNYNEAISAYMAMEDRAKIIGLSATTPQFPSAVKILEQIRTEDLTTRVILGGAHATMVGTAYRMDKTRGIVGRGTNAYQQMTSLFDCVVLGDGERAVFEAIKPDAPKVVDAEIRTSDFFLQRGTLHKYPFPDRELIDFSSYHYTIEDQLGNQKIRKPAQSMIAQLGCPFECGFCGGRDSNSFRMTRSRSPESIVEEIALLAEVYGMRAVMLYDDELNVSPELDKTLHALIAYQKEKGFNLSLRGFVKAELFHPQQAQLMYQAGFRELLSGVESGDGEMLRTMKKHTTPEINSAWVKMCHEAGIRAKALMSVGHPGESAQSIQNSLNWVKANKPDDIDWSLITEYPGSPYFDYSIPHETQAGVWVYTEPKTGNVLYSQDVNFALQAEYYKGVPGDYTSHVWTDHLTRDQLVTLRDLAETESRAFLGLSSIQKVDTSKYIYQVGTPLPGWILRGTGR